MRIVKTLIVAAALAAPAAPSFAGGFANEIVQPAPPPPEVVAQMGSLGPAATAALIAGLLLAVAVSSNGGS